MPLKTRSRAQSEDRSRWSGSMEEKVSTTTKIVNRIRKLSPAALGWRRRSSDQHKLAHDSPCSSKRSQSTSDLSHHFTGQFRLDYSAMTSRNQKETAVNPGDSIITTTSEPCERADYSTRPHNWSMQDLVELQPPDCNVWNLKHQFPQSFISLLGAYLRNMEFSMDDVNDLCDFMKTAHENEDDIPMPRDRLLVRRPNQKRKHSKQAWYVVVNTIINYLGENERYSKRFILRRPGNHVHINTLERALLELIRDQKHTASLQEVTAIIEAYDVNVIGGVLSRLLRKHGPLLPEPIKRLVFQLNAQNKPGVTADDWRRLQRKTMRLLLLIPSFSQRSLVLRPLLELLAKISSDPRCQMDESSLAILFAPVFFAEPELPDVSMLANTLEHLIRLCKHEFITNHSLNSLFKLPRLFVKDVWRNLHANLVAKATNDEPPALICSLTYCINVARSPLREEMASMQPRSRLSVGQLSASQILTAETPEAASAECGSSSSSSNYNTTAGSCGQPRNCTIKRSGAFYRATLGDESRLMPVTKRPRTMLLKEPDSQLRREAVTPLKGQNQHHDWLLDSPKQSTPSIKNALIDTSLSFRVRRKPSLGADHSKSGQLRCAPMFPPNKPSVNSTKETKTQSTEPVNFSFRSPILGYVVQPRPATVGGPHD